MKKALLLVIMSASMFACNNNNDKKIPETKPSIDIKAEVINADRAFSKMSEEKGIKEAFLQYIDSDGVLLRPGYLPLRGANAIDYISQENDSGYTMTWEPSGATVAKSGELAFTYVTFIMQIHGKDSVVKGTYVSVWKKQPDGTWKYVLDSGNDGVGEP